MDADNTRLMDQDMSGIWDDPSFSNLQYDNIGTSDSPFDANCLFDFNATANTESPNFAVRTPVSKTGYEGKAISNLREDQQLPSTSLIASGFAESSSQDSSSESSSRRKRKTTSESPPTTNTVTESERIKTEDTLMDPQDLRAYQTFGTSMNNLSLDQDFGNSNVAMNGHFDFNSAASSPGQINGTNSRLSSRGQMNGPMQRGLQTLDGNNAPSGTVEPAQFFFGSSNASPVSVKASHGQETSPSAMFSNPTPSSDGQDLFGGNPNWGDATQNPAWSNDYSNAFTSPGALGLTPSPVMNSMSHIAAARPSSEENRIPLHIAPIPQKSRVETQINIKMTLERLPPGISQLHLPTHTIAKAKLLAKEVMPREDTLELHTMLVCTSAMSQPHMYERAMQRAAQQDNAEIQARGQSGGMKEETEENEEDKPANGGEVRICANCINRERKRAARKKLKKEEEQAHWEKYETERVIVFNTNEYKPWQEWQQSPVPKDNSAHVNYEYQPSETAVQVIAPMRIACYCRHQNEKDGFRVIFTIKDCHGKVVAQQMSDSILITDDHKTHPMATVPGGVWYSEGQYPAPGPFNASQSMIDLHSQMPAMPMSKSTGNLAGLAYGAPGFHHPSNMHQMSGFTSQATSATMTPRNLSRPASPTGAGSAGPNKKRKSSSAHRRIPSGLTMTRVDTSQPMASNLPSAASGPFSPTGTGFVGGGDASYMTMPHSGTRAHFHTGPPTPSDNSPFAFNSLNRTTSLDNSNFQAFYSAPSSAHQSRAPSPVLQGPNIAAFQRQQAHGGSSTMPMRATPFAVPSSSMGNVVADPERTAPIISKVTPNEGPTSGGIEVSIYGSGFTQGMDVMFGDSPATATTYWGEKALCAVLPPGKIGTVQVTIAGNQSRPYSPPTAAPPQLFTYTGQKDQVHMMELALRFLSEKQSGNPEGWQNLAQSAASAYMSQGFQPQQQHPGMQGPPGSHFATDLRLEDAVLDVLDFADIDDSPHPPCYDIAHDESGVTMLSLACSLGLRRAAAALLARGANPDVRDRGGYTPLMMAVMHGRTQLLKLLLMRGADASMRSLRGLTAADLAPSATVLAFLQQAVHQTKRSRHSRPRLPYTRSMSSMTTSSKASWDISDASYYTESEADVSPSPWIQSRRGSAQVGIESSLPEEHPSMASPTAAMMAWRDSLAAQIHHFQQNVHLNMPNFQLPALPPLPNIDYQDNSIARRISSLVPYRSPSRTETRPVPDEAARTPSGESRFWDFFSGPSTPAPPPPAYEELFPTSTKPVLDQDLKKASAVRAVADAMADRKCEEMLDCPRAECSDVDTLTANATEVRSGMSDAKLLFVWMPLIVAVTMLSLHMILPIMSTTCATLRSRLAVVA